MASYPRAPWHRGADCGAGEPPANAWVSKQINGLLRYDYEYTPVRVEVLSKKLYEVYGFNISSATIEHCVRASMRRNEPYFEY